MSFSKSAFVPLTCLDDWEKMKFSLLNGTQ